MKANVNDYIVLSDRMGDTYKEYPCNTGIDNGGNCGPVAAHENDFQFVFLHQDEKPFYPARRCHSFSSSQLIAFTEIEGKIFAVTRLFLVDLEAALLHNEIKIQKERLRFFCEEKPIVDTIEEIAYTIDIMEMGLLTVEETNNYFYALLEHYFLFNQKKWLTNYFRSITGSLHPIKRS